jgi:hypothetical protein
MMDTFHKSLTSFFDEILDDIGCQRDTRAYIVSIYEKYKTTEFDLSKDSITLLFAQGRDKQDFLTYQKLGDYIFFANTLIPTHLVGADKNYYDTIARLSYYSCYRLLNRQWKLFQELADNFPILEQEVKYKLSSLKMTETYGDNYIVPFGS